MTVRIAMDAMGGDAAPLEVVRGIVRVPAGEVDEIILVGDQTQIESAFQKIRKHPPSFVRIHHASEVITMEDIPVTAVKQKKDASMNVAMQLVKDGKADAFVSAGNTGALVASALLTLGRIKGIERPAVVLFIPTPTSEVMILDVGATVNCKPKHLVQFAVMGSAYMERVKRIENPRVGILNVGSEEDKGDNLAQESFPLLQKAPINFIGNVEGTQILEGKVDVAVCDGFVGNIVLKFLEQIGLHIFRLLKEEFKSHPIARLGIPIVAPAFSGMRKRVDHEEHGGSPLLGVNGVCFKIHGRSKAKAFRNIVPVVRDAVEGQLVQKIADGASRMDEAEVRA